MADINKIRKEIDQIDKELLPLFLKRMDCSHLVAEYKIANNMPILDKEREQEILRDKAAQVCDSLKESVVDFYSSIMRISRNAQQREIFEAAVQNQWEFPTKPLIENPTVAYQGIPGANSETALMEFFGEKCKKVNVMTFGEVLDAIDDGAADYGILPIENSSTGSISATYDLLSGRNFYILGEVKININHCLVAPQDAEIRDIKKVYSHEQGFMQCKDFFRNHPKMVFEPYHNTALAAKMISGLGDPSVAAIADHRTASLYNLKVLADNISSTSTNITRFVVISKSGYINSDCNKTSILFTLPDESGALSHILQVFADCELNLAKIQSMPNPAASFEYMFFVDFEGNLENPQTIGALNELSKKCASLRILGNYPSV